MNLSILSKPALVSALLLLLGVFYPAMGKAIECSSMWAKLLKYRAIAPENSLITVGKAEKAALPTEHLRVTLWNVHKHSHKNWERDFHNLSLDAELMLIQETVASADGAAVSIVPGREWTAARSFETNGVSTGVATGSRAAAIRHTPMRSVVQEPILRTPKTALVSEYPIEGRDDTLMVINVHAINFTRIWKFRSQVDQIVVAAAMHDGPVIVAGDMNTWSKGRINLLSYHLGTVGLKEATLPRDQFGVLVLDRMFYRGLTEHWGRVRKDVRTSDHAPLEFHFSVNPDQPRYWD